VRTPSCCKTPVAHVRYCCDEGRQPVLHVVGDGQVDGVIAVASIVVVDEDAPDRGRDDEVRIAIAVPVRIRGQIIVKEKAADLEELRDGLAVIAGQPLERSTGAP